jgi:ribonuclease J
MSHPHPELGPPPPLPDGGLRITPLGGLGEVGRNMTVLEHDGALLIVDCGVLFPEDHQPGVDLVLPDFEPIRHRLDDVVALVLTHGHEDHIGAVPYLLRERADIPLVGSRLTLALLAAKLAEHRMQPRQQVVREEERLAIGPFDCEFLAGNHSIPDALAVVVRTSAGVLLHTGDFKMDQLPLDGRLTDLPGFARLGDDGVDVLLVDSTNAEVPGFTPPERDIAAVLDRVFHRTPGRIVVASFASHVHRVQQVLDAAVAHGRRVAFVGRSMVRNMTVARDLGYLAVPGGTLVELKQALELPRESVVFMSTGSQGEPMAALSRIANGDHPQISVEAGDVVVLASSLIPGNENAVSRVINGLSRHGVAIVHKGNANVHVSGHASAGELTYAYNLVRPRHVLPVHGEHRHLRANAQVAISTGVPSDRVLVVEDGVVVDLVDGKAAVVGAVPVGNVFVDGTTIGDLAEASVRDRRILAEDGFVSVVVVLDSTTGTIVAGPEIHARGLAEDDSVFDAVRPRIAEAVQEAASHGYDDVYELQQTIRRVIGPWLNRRLRRRPMIIPVVVEL